MGSKPNGKSPLVMDLVSLTALLGVTAIVIVLILMELARG
jgi:hypothetical protein